MEVSYESPRGGRRRPRARHRLGSVQSPKVKELYCAPGNGGIASLATCVPIKATDVDAMVDWCAAHEMDFVVVAPDDPLALGMVDALEAKGIPAFGPGKTPLSSRPARSFPRA